MNILRNGVVFCSIVLLSFNSLHSAETEKDNDVLTFRQIQSPVLCIDSIDGDAMIIEDRLFQRFQGTQYFDTNGKPVSSGQFKVGTCVKVKTDNGNRLLALYEAVDNEVPNPDVIVRERSVANSVSAQPSVLKETSPTEPALKKSETIKKEGNVWKN